MYLLRDKDLTLVASLSDEVVGELLAGGCGHWAEMTLTTGKVNAYVIDIEYTITWNDHKLFVWKGSCLYKPTV